MRALREHILIVRPQRARRTVWLLLSYPSEAALCAGTVDHQAPSPLPNVIFKRGLVDPRVRASNEHIPIVRVPRAGGRPGYP